MATRIKFYWIKERHKPYSQGTYYVACGQLSKTAARQKEKSVAGTNIMWPYETKEQYEAQIESLKSQGLTVLNELD